MPNLGSLFHPHGLEEAPVIHRPGPGHLVQVGTHHLRWIVFTCPILGQLTFISILSYLAFPTFPFSRQKFKFPRLSRPCQIARQDPGVKRARLQAHQWQILKIFFRGNDQGCSPNIWPSNHFLISLHILSVGGDFWPICQMLHHSGKTLLPEFDIELPWKL